MSVRKRTWKNARGEDKEAWIVDYVDGQGARHIKTFARKKDADVWLVTARHELQQGTHTAASLSITVAEGFERWIAHCEAEGLEFGTIKQRRQHLALHIAPFIGREKLATLTTPRVHQFDAELRDASRSVQMRRKVLTNLKTAITFCQGQGLSRRTSRGASRSRATIVSVLWDR